MSALVMGLVWELPETPEFGRPEKYVLLAYADHADSNGRNIYPSIELVMRKTFYEERSVQSITRRLEQTGYLVDSGVGPNGTNRWSIPIVLLRDGGAKIAPVQKTTQNFAPEGIAPEGIAPKPSVVVKTDERYAKIGQALISLTGGMVNSMTADMIEVWMEKHTDEWILKAIEIARAKKARSANYVDSILVGWEANGYPKNRDQRVQGAKDDRPVSNRGGKPVEQAAPTDADREAAELVRQRKQGSHV